ncbi:hypothetical protein AMS59_17840 [Lysinibacillus sp. FJAT-14745]|uniref:hypothetical protein n=1 Tax=Lysinibacillus sp. FJAT-14745 TaxID=1704289 RepID=UPI0006AB7730|nr:hypothetical protein [Lysinibacillus sp. FJAT-14745]KOP72763.1 hypothetical protein AMS59_17840 [Lysinibacillus sp. FJAT-14745]
MSRFTRAARSRVSGQQDVGHEGVITGRDAFSLRSSISLIPKESLSLHSNQRVTLIYSNKTKLQATVFFCESEASATMVYLCESGQMLALRKASNMERKSPSFKAPKHSQRFA